MGIIRTKSLFFYCLGHIINVIIRKKLKKLKNTDYHKYKLTKISYRGYFMNCNQDIDKYLQKVKYITKKV